MQQVLIVGSGAASAELVMYIDDHNRHVPYTEQFEVMGFIEYEENRNKYWSKYNNKKPIVGDLDTFDFDQGVHVLIAIGNTRYRSQILEKLRNKDIHTNFIHYSSMIDGSVVLGCGNIIYPHCIVGPQVVIGNWNLITSYSFVSHDCRIGNNNIMSTSGLAGHVEMGNNNFLGIRSTCLPGISIGSNNIIQAGMIVDKSIPDGTTVFYRYKEKLIVGNQ